MSKVPVLLFILLGCSFNVSAQRVSIGVKGGSVPSDAFESQLDDLTDESKRYIVGPSVEVALPWGFAVEFDALYRRIGFDTFRDHRVSVRERGNAWELPILAKYRIKPSAAFHPFAVIGVAPRLVSGSSGFNYTIPLFHGDVPQSASYKPEYGNTHGFVVGGGLEYGSRRARFSTEARYIHWDNEIYHSFTGGCCGGWNQYSTQDQVEVLFGFSWK
jgi:opacity protein-like surface antigen